MKSSGYLKNLALTVLILTLPAVKAFAQQTISGTVTDAEKGKPLIGVNILVKGTTSGTTTDNKGHYQLDVTSLQDTLIFSFVGYKTQKVPISGRTTINIALKPQALVGKELVVVGYGKQEKKMVTGSISTVQGKTVDKAPAVNITNSLAGKIPGVIVNSHSGEPGYDGSSILIRGQSTLNNSNPLIVVNGVPSALGSLGRLDPNNIKNISVLKGAAAAIYGARAANGVILVKTKEGHKGEIQVTYSFNQGFATPTMLPEMADAATYARIRNEIAYYQSSDGGLNQIFTKSEIKKFKTGSDPLNYPNTDWVDLLLRSYAPQSRQSLSISGGSENVQFYVSGGYLSQGAIYENSVTHYNQYNISADVNIDINEHLNLGVVLRGRKEDRVYPISSASSIFSGAMRAFPTINAFYSNGLASYGIEGNNPIVKAAGAGGKSSNPKYVFNGKIRGSYELPFVDGLTISGYLAVDKVFNHTESFTVPYKLYQHARNSNNFEPVLIGVEEAQKYENQSNSSLITESIRLKWEKQINSIHHIEAFVGFEQSIEESDYFSATRTHFPTVQTPELSQGGNQPIHSKNAGGSSRFTRRSFMGRISYNYEGKYLAKLQFRYDGSSIFPEGEQYGFFPSGSVGWRISEEPWFPDNIITNLKIKASHGLLGNDRVAAFQYASTYIFGGGYVIGQNLTPTILLSQLGNPNITWEVAYKTDIGLNVTLFNKLDIEVTAWQDRRENILTFRNASIPALTGIVNPYGSSKLVPAVNIGKVTSRGIEAKIHYQDFVGDVMFQIGGNFTFAKSEIIYMDEAPGILPWQSKTGRPLGSRLLYKAIGIFNNEQELKSYPHVEGAQPGDLKYLDYNEDGEITAADRVRVGTTDIPQIQYGINLGVNWNDFSLSAYLLGQARVSQYILPMVGTVGNAPKYWAKNRWSPNNKDGTYPRITTRANNAISGGLYSNTFWLRNSAFLRLKNVKITYNISPEILPDLNWDGASVYVSGYNLLTITPAKGFDPAGDSGNGYFYPTQTIYNVGFTVNF